MALREHRVMRRAGGVVFGVLLLLGGLAACGDDDDAAPDTTSSTTSSTTAPAGDELELVERAVDEFSERSVTFANLTYTLLDATVTNADLRAYADGTAPEATAVTHLVLDVRVTNDSGRQLESDEDAIALELADRRVGLADPFLSDVTGFIGANQDVDGFLAFELDDDALSVGDAVLVLGVAPDRPARLPLTADVGDDPLPVARDLSGSADGVGPTNGGTLRFDLVGMRLFADLPHGDTTSPTGERADEGELFLQVHVRVTKTEGRGNDVLADAFRLDVDGAARPAFDVATAPEGSAATPTAEPDVTVDAWVLFTIDTSAESYTLLVGDADENPGSLPLDELSSLLQLLDR